jgi:hypothetical protein
MTGSVATLVAFSVLALSVVLIFAIVSLRITSVDKSVRESLAQQLPAADVNYLLSTESIDTDNIESIINLAHRIRSIRSPLKQKNIRNSELWIVISLMIAEQRQFQRRVRLLFRLTAVVFVALILVDAAISIVNLH